ncbi:MAG: single-stranded DNA-binding protein [Bacteroidetes bacterium]|nr:single-stranded DNA-binding protein [Bacteroidota bacterium]MCY4223557.1 single-stranded DNA-binding protein [Bacteroidota bacterium]
MQNISVNKVLLIGTVEGEPTLKYTQYNKAVLNLRVLTTETYANREGQPVESRASHTVVVWGQRAERLKDQLRPQSRILIEGRIKNRSYEDSTGQRKWVVEVDAQTAIVLVDETYPQNAYSPPLQPQPYPASPHQTAPYAQQPYQGAPSAYQPHQPMPAQQQPIQQQPGQPLQDQQAPVQPQPTQPPPAPAATPSAPENSTPADGNEDDLPF